MPIEPARMRAVFLEELEEHHRTLQDGLLELERDASALDRILPELFRAAHSLKGGAQMVRLPAVAACCHRLEEVFAALREGETALTSALHATLLADVDALAALAAELRTDPTDGGTPAGPAPPDTPPVPTSDTTEPASDQAVEPPPDDAAAPQQGPPGGTGTAGGPSKPALRVPADRLDSLLDRAGDVRLARDQLSQLVQDTRQLADAAAQTSRRWQEVRPHVTGGMTPRPAAAITAADRAWQHTDELIGTLRPRTATASRLLHEAAAGLEHSTRTLRLQPLRLACDGLERAVRDLTHGSDMSDRQVRLAVDDGDVELDGEVVTALRDPLLHLIRNAVAHGIEPTEVRQRAGKPDVATVRVSAHVLGDQVEVRVTDDGAGLDLDGLRAGAAASGIDTEDGDVATARLAWLAGLSTAPTVGDVAGRGVGLDAVRNRVEQLGGTVELTSAQGEGCTVALHLPVTLTTMHALIVLAEDQTLALPSAALRRVVRIPAGAIHTTGGRPHVMVDDELAGVVSLRAFLGLAPAPAREHHPAVLMTGARGPAVLIVDQIVTADRMTRRQLHPRLVGAPGLLGTTLLPTGGVAMVLNPLACLRDPHEVSFVTSEDPSEVEAQQPTILLAEDSATTRALEQDILERAGYTVLAAADGAEAWQMLRERHADLVVSDIDMPGMDGFALCHAIRQHPKLAQIPVVLLTSKASDEDRHRGVEAGANAYLVKGAFDPAAFLTTIERLL